MRKKEHGVFLTIVLAVLAGGIIPAIFTLGTKIYENSYIPPKAVDNLKNVGEIYNELFELKKNSGSNRIILLRAHDSGGPIPNKSSTVAEVLDEDMEKLFSNWQSQPLDMGYIRLLEQLVDSKRVVLTTEELEDSLLKDVYLSREIIKSDVRYLGANKDSIYYISLGFKSDRIFDPKYMDDVRSSVQKIKEILNKAEVFKL